MPWLQVDDFVRRAEARHIDELYPDEKPDHLREPVPTRLQHPAEPPAVRSAPPASTPVQPPTAPRNRQRWRRSPVPDAADVLRLLAAGPANRSQLAAELACSLGMLDRALRDEGRVTRVTGGRDISYRWALAGTEVTT